MNIFKSLIKFFTTIFKFINTFIDYITFNRPVKKDPQFQLSYPKPQKKGHPFHLVERSSLPIRVALWLGPTAFFFVETLHPTVEQGYRPHIMLLFSLFFLFYTIAEWANQIVIESFQGHHTPRVVRGLMIGFMLFLLSEAMFFFSFFWAFAYYAVAPSIWIGGVWPPTAIVTVQTFGIPLCNTVVLLTSALTLTIAHLGVIKNLYQVGRFNMRQTLIMSYTFLILQFFEYVTSPFSIADGVYGSIFFGLTGLHGFHVIGGTIYLIYNKIRHDRRHFTPQQHVGFITAAWYWHFVDVVWVLVYGIVYVWGNSR